MLDKPPIVAATVEAAGSAIVESAIELFIATLELLRVLPAVGVWPVAEHRIALRVQISRLVELPVLQVTAGLTFPSRRR